MWPNSGDEPIMSSAQKDTSHVPSQHFFPQVRVILLPFRHILLYVMASL